MIYLLVIAVVLQFVIIHALWERLVDLRQHLELHNEDLRKIWQSEALRPEYKEEYYKAFGVRVPDDVPHRTVN